MIIRNSHIVPLISEGVRILDYTVNLFPQLPSKNSIKKAIKSGELILNGKAVESGRWLKEGDIIELRDLELNPPKTYELELEVVFEDEYLAVINKPAGIVTSGNQFKTIENTLAFNITDSTQEDRLKWPKPVHRLDAPTSGLLLVSKTIQSHILLGQLFEKKDIQKTYHAIVQGKTKAEGKITSDIGHQKAITNYTKLEQVPSLQNQFISLLQLQPLTGRTHQLRKHLSGISHPIIGDKLYGKEGNLLKNKGLFLAATQLEFIHPISKHTLKIEIPIPHKFTSLLEREQRRWSKYNPQ